VSRDETGIEITATESVLPARRGTKAVASCSGETGFRLIAAPGPALIRARVAELVKHVGVDLARSRLVVAHPRGASVLDAVADGLSVERTKLASGYAAWERSGNMVSASVYRALALLAEDTPPRAGDIGLLIAFGTGVSCEMALARWHDAPIVARA
jgi:alkylresorcinol/alkylpyrone synthase